MTFISSRLAESLNGRADARFPGEILPGPFLNLVIAGAAFTIRLLPGMATFSPVILSPVIGIARHNIVGMAALAKQGATFSLRWLLRMAVFRLGLQLICGASAVIAANADNEDVAGAIACVTVFGSVAMFAHPIPAGANAWIVAATTFLSVALAAIGLETDIARLTAKGFRPALLGALAFLFIAGFSLTLIKLME
jgi:uncharacterized membrane protein YadS